ncbi:hypothetical protein AAC387_Pa02g1724 [Persea americana]
MKRKKSQMKLGEEDEGNRRKSLAAKALRNLGSSGSRNNEVKKEEGRVRALCKASDTSIFARDAGGKVNCLTASPETERLPMALLEPLHRLMNAQEKAKYWPVNAQFMEMPDGLLTTFRNSWSRQNSKVTSS